MDVLFGLSAAVKNGLSSSFGALSTYAVNMPELDGFEASGKYFYYRPNLDRIHFLTPGIWREQRCLIPSKERTVIDFIQNQDVLYEGDLCMAIDYYHQEKNGDLSELYKVADVMGCPREEVDHWLYEAQVVGY